MSLIASAGHANGYQYFIEVKAPLEVTVQLTAPGQFIEKQTSTVKGAIDWIKKQTNYTGQLPGENF